MLIVFFLYIAITLLLIWFLVSHNKGPKLPARALWSAFGFGTAAIILAVSLELLLVHYNPARTSLFALFATALLIGLIEETSKFLPLAKFIYKKEYFRDLTDGIIFFAICGLGFGLLENFTYLFAYGTRVGILRIVFVPIFHASGTAIVGYFLARKKIRELPWMQTFFALVAVIIIHGLYDFGLMSGVIILIPISFLITISLAIGLFVFFARARKIDKDNNYYCPHCGKTIPINANFCPFCDKKMK